MKEASLDIKDLQLNALLEVTQAVNNNLPEDDLLKIYKFTLLADLKINKLALYTQREGNWICRVNFGTKNNLIGSSLPEEYMELKNQMGLVKASFDEFDAVFPVYHKNKLLAVVFIESDSELGVQNRFLNALTNIILVAIENKRLARQQMEQEAYRRELEIAKKVQNFLFPKELPKIERLQIEAFYLPHHDVGGDYYDYIQIDENKFLACIADVSGKGVPAALLMSNFQASLRALVRQTKNLKEIIEELNLTTYVSGNAENFITFFAGIYDFKTKELEYINCGHNEIILKHEDKIELLNDGTTVLGMFDPLPFLETKKLPKLDEFFLFTYTDGLTETFNENDEAFEFDRLLEIIKGECPEDLSDLHDQILKSLNEFKGSRSFHDDITMLSCRIQNK
ncbi:PP2C family protein-serine/threonine phosphatase [Ekhidna sp. MALMAid0563]|uniref:PP2C family protein-serine/threonine phosphatase n=1 Tax=Ekhidna sp. MALMAid0563 TaxID=3143937 RepID=UPI0032DF42AA